MYTYIFKKQTNKQIQTIPPPPVCSTSAEPLGVEYSLLKTYDPGFWGRGFSLCYFAIWGVSSLIAITNLFRFVSFRLEEKKLVFKLVSHYLRRRFLPPFPLFFCGENVQLVIHLGKSVKRGGREAGRLGQACDTSPASAGLHFSGVASGYLT